MIFKTAVRTCLLVLFAIAFQTNADIKNLSLESDRIVGKYYVPSNAAKKVGVMVLGGSEGGIPERLANGVAEAGYPTLALAYFNVGDLPKELERIPLEYFDRASAWLRTQPEVSTEEVLIVGWSKGAELALLLASRDEGIRKVIAIAPSSVVWAGILKDWTKVPRSSWTENGEQLPHVEFKPTGPVTGLLDLYTQSLENRADEGEADIPVEKIEGDVLLMTGELDEIWPSPVMAEEVCKRINNGQNEQCQHLTYEGLDHLLDYKFLNNTDPMHKVFIDFLDGS